MEPLGGEFRSQKQIVISDEQEKLLRNAMRIRILRALYDQPMTAKQVSDELGGSKGNVHYHVRQLYEGGLLDLVETRESGGIVEKYYQAKASIYTKGQSLSAQNLSDAEHRVTWMGTRLTLTPSQLAELNNELVEVLTKWEGKTVRSNGENASDYEIEISVSGPGKFEQESDAASDETVAAASDGTLTATLNETLGVNEEDSHR